MPSLFVFEGNDQGTRFELKQDTIGLGRDNGNDIQLHDTEVSRRHAAMRRDADGYSIADLGSSNGTFVNGRQVQTHHLVTGDELLIGSTRMLYTGGKAESAQDLAQKIDIIAKQQPDDRSRIVHTLPQEEGSRIFDLGADMHASPWLMRAHSNLQSMYRTTLAVSHTLDIDQLLNRIMQLIFEWVEADRGCIMLYQSEARSLEPKVRRTRQGVGTEDKITISKTILDYVIEHNEGVLTSDAREDTRWNPAASILQMGVREAICVPMQGRYNTVGIIYIDTSISPQKLIQTGQSTKFNEEHLKLMIAIAHQAALAVEDTRYYSAMVQAERLAAVGQTIATLSHHIKNILQGIRGGSFLIKEGLSRHDETMVGKGWEFVERNQERISHLVMDMLTFSKEREPEMVSADLNRVVADVTELMQSRADEHRVRLATVPTTNMPTLTFDPEGLHRAILNIVTNAIDACGKDSTDDEQHQGEVRVLTQFDRAAGMARIVIEDNGSGIPAEQLEQIFSLFHSTKGGRGTGLGLPVSQKILKEHNGRIAVESQPGKGSRFVLEFPAVYSDLHRTQPMNDPRETTG